jgi:hypothetical protein
MEATFDPAQLGPLRQKARRKTSAVLAPENAPAVTPFDPRQVGQPSAAQQQALEQLHQQCAQNIAEALSARLRASVEATCASVERASGADFLEKLPEPACLALLGRAGGSGSAADGSVARFSHPGPHSGGHRAGRRRNPRASPKSSSSSSSRWDTASARPCRRPGSRS